jgi:hypothetical protein
MRDLATYECNYSQSTSSFRGMKFNTNLVKLNATLNDAMNKLKMHVAFDDEGEAYFTDKKVDEDGNTIKE